MTNGYGKIARKFAQELTDKSTSKWITANTLPRHLPDKSAKMIYPYAARYPMKRYGMPILGSTYLLQKQDKQPALTVAPTTC